MVKGYNWENGECKEVKDRIDLVQSLWTKQKGKEHERVKKVNAMKGEVNSCEGRVERVGIDENQNVGGN